MTNNRKLIYYILSSAIVIAVLMLLFWTNRTYTVHFNTGGGTIYKSIEVKPGSKVKRPEDPVLEGYTFEGWFLNDTDTRFTFKETIEEDTTITARWKSITE